MTTTPNDDSEKAMSDQKLVIERVFDAPRELVWRAWTEPEMFARWYGPNGFTVPVCKIDFRVGGTFLTCMSGPENFEYWTTGVYREIVPIERIVATESPADPEGNVVSPTHYGMSAEMPLETLRTVILETYESNKTKMVFEHVGLPSREDQDGAGRGWNQAFDKLADYLVSVSRD